MSQNFLQTLAERSKYVLRPVLFLIILMVFFIAIEMTGAAIKLLNEEVARSFISATSNPFIGLFIGLLSTVILQSSSVSTSMIVAIVASGTVSLQSAVPMIMGANIGTTVTSTIVSIGHIANRNRFRKAFSAGTTHDVFNILVTAILFPLEYYFGVLSGIASVILSYIPGFNNTGGSTPNLFTLTIRELAYTTANFFSGYPIAVLLLAGVLLFGSLHLLTLLVRQVLIGPSQKRFDEFVFGNTLKSFAWGTSLTAALQSSTVITSLTVPLVASGKVQLQKIFPFIVGANVGTTITAMLAAAYKSDAAVSLALTHVLFNVIGALIFLPFPLIRQIPVRIATALGNATIHSRSISFMYMVATFFLVPFVLIYLTEQRDLADKDAPAEKAKIEQFYKRLKAEQIKKNHSVY